MTAIPSGTSRKMQASASERGTTTPRRRWTASQTACATRTDPETGRPRRPRPIFIRDGAVSTAAGVTSALDLTLAFVEEDHGPELARQVARELVTYLQRPGNQAQMSVHVTAPPPQDTVVRDVVAHVTAHLDGDLSAARLAGSAGVSERHLTRLFLEQLHQTPGRFVRQARLEAAAHLLVSTELPVSRVAARCGFGSAETLRQAFVARYGTSPSGFRRTQVRRGRP